MNIGNNISALRKKKGITQEELANELGDARIEEKGYYITDACIGCGTCQSSCPQRCITEGEPFTIQQNHCLHCGSCYENCPVQAIERRGQHESSVRAF